MAAARSQLKMKSSALTGSPLENLTLFFILKVYVIPSVEIVGAPVAMSGTSFSWSSNLYRPEYVLRKMSMSTAADMVPGSRLPTSSTIGKLSVWSEARFSDGALLPPPHAASIETAPTATARERNTAIRVIPPPTKHGSRRAHLGNSLHDIHRPLPASSGARVRRRRIFATFRWPRYSTFSFELCFTEVKFR